MTFTRIVDMRTGGELLALDDLSVTRGGRPLDLDSHQFLPAPER